MSHGGMREVMVSASSRDAMLSASVLTSPDACQRQGWRIGLRVEGDGGRSAWITDRGIGSELAWRQRLWIERNTIEIRVEPQRLTGLAAAVD
jgi:hypothetical protein